MNEQILLVEDDSDLADVTRMWLQDHDFQVTLSTNLTDAEAFLRKNRPDIIVLDVNLPDGSGFDFLQDLRAFTDIPVLLASARVSEDDRIQGFGAGGDDYLPKPYSLKELVFRIRAILRRTKPQGQSSELRCGPFVLNKEKNVLYKNDKEINLAAKETDLLAFFMEHPNQSFQKSELLQSVWGPYSEAEESTVSVHIRWLREKLEDNPSSPAYLLTVWGRGYRFEVNEKLDGQTGQNGQRTK